MRVFQPVCLLGVFGGLFQRTQTFVLPSSLCYCRDVLAPLELFPKRIFTHIHKQMHTLYILIDKLFMFNKIKEKSSDGVYVFVFVCVCERMVTGDYW